MQWRLNRFFLALKHIWKVGSIEYAIDFITHRKLATRKGNCNQCGKCCGIKNKCKYNMQNGRCSIYRQAGQQKAAPWCFQDCPYGPAGLVDGCGYYWDKK